jgi:hypothetical protein
MGARRGASLNRAAANIGDKVDAGIRIDDRQNCGLRRLNGCDRCQDTTGAFQTLKSIFMRRRF